MPISTISSKFAFIAGRRILDEKRNRMTSEMVEMLLYFKDWLNKDARLQDKSGHSTISSDKGDTNETDN